MMGAFPDTHIFREHGGRAADEARQAASVLQARLEQTGEPGSLMQDIMILDRRLKELGHNPGTSADLTVATLFAVRLGEGSGEVGSGE
jgi:triphosphoribosyl-dephospho-CoA synthase